MLKKLGPIIVILVLFTACSKDKIVYETYHYDKNDVSFTVEYPKEWTVKEIKVWDATSNEEEAEEVREASPERGGVDIYPQEDSEVSIGIYNVVSPYYMAENQAEDISTSELLNDKIKIADITQYTTDGKVYLHALYSKDSPSNFYVAIVRVTEEYFKEKEEIIWNIIKSLKY